MKFTLNHALYAAVRRGDLKAIKPESGVLSTASDLVFAGGREGYFYALDARDGSLLWKTNVGGNVASGARSRRSSSSGATRGSPAAGSRRSSRTARAVKARA